MRAWGRGPSFLPVSSLVSSHGTLACCDHGIRRRSLWELGQFAIAKSGWQAKFYNLITSIMNVIVVLGKSQAGETIPSPHNAFSSPCSFPANSLLWPRELLCLCQAGTAEICPPRGPLAFRPAADFKLQGISWRRSRSGLLCAPFSPKRD